ncbi:MAG TPA: efflux RND transporter periplasmic adaptor subunit, partial [Candidatus Udaeobacter sp.]|nr:efflux RND transporter periplasmic adaptor subunit [Candidatus Udaeobacter sp.]
MKKVLAVALVGLLMLFSYVVGRKHVTHSTTAGASTRRVLYWVDPMHPDFKSDHPGVAPDCGMQLEPVYAESISASSSTPAPMAAGMVGIDAERQQLFGIRVSTVERSSGAENVRVLGRVVPEDTRVYRLNAGMEGFIRQTFDDSPGELVKKDQKLATYYGGDILAVASGFLAATAGVPGANGKDGSRTVPFPGALSKQGSSSVQGYTDRLRNLGMSDAQIQEIAETQLLPDTVNVVSPVDGFVLA